MKKNEKRCEICGKIVPDDEELIEFNIYSGDDDLPFSTSKICKECAEPLSKLSSEEFNMLLKRHIEDLEKNWKTGTAENTKVGDIIKIISLKGEDDHTYLYKTGVVNHIDDIGQLHGTWGGLAIIPSEDVYLVFKGEDDGKEN